MVTPPDYCLHSARDHAFFLAFLPRIPASCLLKVPGAFPVIFPPSIRLPQLHQQMSKRSSNQYPTQDEAVCISHSTNTLGKSMIPTIFLSKQEGRLSYLALVWQRIKVKENSEFKLDIPHFEIDLRAPRLPNFHE